MRHVATSASRQRSQSSGLTADTRRLPCCSRTAWWLLGCTLSLSHSHSCTLTCREREARTLTHRHTDTATLLNNPQRMLRGLANQNVCCRHAPAFLPDASQRGRGSTQVGHVMTHMPACHTHAQCVPHSYDFFSTYFLPFCLFDSFTCFVVVVQLFRILILPAQLDCPLAAL